MPEPAEPDFEVIVIGAGIAGCVTAYQLARQGRSVLLIERGEAPGSKNLSGGVLYSRGIQEVFPEFLDEAPVERRITRNYVNFLNADSSVAIDYKDARLADPVNAVTVLRAKLDAWLAAEVRGGRRPRSCPASAWTGCSPRTVPPASGSSASRPATTSCGPTWSSPPTA